jgi:hypothetical protein
VVHRVERQQDRPHGILTLGLCAAKTRYQFGQPTAYNIRVNRAQRLIEAGP